METIKTPIYDETGKVNGIQISFWDITDRKRAEEDLLPVRTVPWLEASVEGSVHDRVRLSDGKPIYLNEALLKMTGYTREEAMRLTFADIASDSEEMRKIQATVDLKVSSAASNSSNARTAPFFPTSFSTSFHRRSQRDGPLPYSPVSLILPSANRQNRRRRKARSASAILYNNATIGLYRTTPDGQILMVNPTGLRLLGFDTFEEMAKRNLEQSGFEEVNARKKFREKLERENIIEQESIWTKKI